MNSHIAFKHLAERRGLIVGMADEHSISWRCARSASALGARLVLSSLNEPSANAAAPLAAQLDAPLLACNAGRGGTLEAMVAVAARQLGAFDFVVHSLGDLPRTGPRAREAANDADAVTDGGAEDLLQAMRNSYQSFAQLARLCGPHMAPGGVLVTTTTFQWADDASQQPRLSGQVKASLESIVRYLAVELEPWGIRVHAVSPGPAPARPGHAASGLEPRAPHRAANALQPMYFAGLDEIGDCVAFLVGPEATGITGQTHYIDTVAHAVQ